MVPHQEHHNFQKQQITQKVQHPNIQSSGTQQNTQYAYASRQQQERTFLSRSQPQQQIFASGQNQSRMSQPSMLGLQQLQQLKMERNPNALQGIRQEFVSPQQTLHLSQLHQQQYIQKTNDQRFTGLLPQNGMINQRMQPNQSGRVLPGDSSALSNSPSPNQCASLTDWHDRVYAEVQSMKNLYSLKLDDIYKTICGMRFQNPEAEAKFRRIKNSLVDTCRVFKMSRDEFKNLSMDKVNTTNQRMKSIGSFVSGFSNWLHRQQQQPPPGSQSQLPTPEAAVSSPQIPTQYIMPNPQANNINAAHTGSLRSMDHQTRHQMFQSQNVNQPIRHTLLDPKKQTMSVSDVNGSKFGQVVQTIPGILQQPHSVGQLRVSPHLNANSPQTSRSASSHLHWQNRASPLPLSTVGMSSQNGSPRGAHFSPSPLSPNFVKSSTISPVPGAGSAESSQGPAKDLQILSQTTNKDQAASTSSSETLASPLVQEAFLPEENQKGISNESELQRLLDVVKSMPNEALCATVDDIGSSMNTIGGATVNCESGALAYYPENVLHGGEFNLLSEMASARSTKRHFSAISAPEEVPANDGLHGLSSETNNLESTAARRTKMPKFQHNTVLLDEIRETNKRLVETELDVVLDSTKTGSSFYFGEGTIVRCTYTPIGFGRNIELRKSGSRLLPLFCVDLLVPADYPKSSPVLLKDDDLLCGLSEAVEQDYDLTKKVNMRFSSCLRGLSQHPSLKEMARKWDDCARSVLAEFAVSRGGGSFSTKYGKWENCM